MKFLVKSIGRSVPSTRRKAFLKTRKPQNFRSGEDDAPNNVSAWGIDGNPRNCDGKHTVDYYSEELLK
jgi:hypothetical protein